MRTHPVRLIAAGALALGLAGCAGAPETGSEPGVHTYTDDEGLTYTVPLLAYPDFETPTDLAAAADVVLVGTVTESASTTLEVRAPVNPQAPSGFPEPGELIEEDWPHLTYEVEVGEVVEGEAANTVTLVVPQTPTRAEADSGVAMTFPGPPWLEEEGEYVFFLVAGDGGDYRLLNNDHSVFAAGPDGLAPVPDELGQERLEDWMEDLGEHWGPTPEFLIGVEQLMN